MKKGWAVVILSLIFQVSFAQTVHKLNKARELDVTDKINVLLIPSEKNELVIDGELKDDVQFIQQGDVVRLKMNTGKI